MYRMRSIVRQPNAIQHTNETDVATKWRLSIGIVFQLTCLFSSNCTFICSKFVTFLTEIRDFCYKDSIPGRKGKKSILFVRVG